MQKGKVNFVVDAFHGSSGKGKIATYLADKYRPEWLLSTNMPNAGHTAVENEKAFVSKVLPTPAILTTWRKDYQPHVALGGSSSFFIERLLQEIKECGVSHNRLWIHPRAGVVLTEHAERERGTLDGPKSIASTMQGCGTFMSDKILRRPGLKLAKDYKELRSYVPPKPFADIIRFQLDEVRATMLAEVSQGIGLDILHGSHYPNCTSRCCTPMQFAADFGLQPKDFGDVYLNLRPYPIRVGNVVEDGKTIGYSGDFFPDAKETTWEEVGQKAGMPEDEIKALLTKEKTTVTKRLRRVFEFSEEGFLRAVRLSGATILSLNFAQYIDWKAKGIKGGRQAYEMLPAKVREFVDHLEEISGLPVQLIGTGIEQDEVIDRTLP